MINIFLKPSSGFVYPPQTEAAKPGFTVGLAQNLQLPIWLKAGFTAEITSGRV
jgi:hypothetical protein